MNPEQNEQPLSKAFFQQVMEGNSEDQNAAKLVLSDLVTAINKMGGDLRAIKEQQAEHGSQKGTLATEDQEAIKHELQKIKLKIDLFSPKKARNFQILLFPEQDRKLFYKIVFGRWLVILAIMLLLNNLYKFGIRWSDNKREISIQQIENDRIQKAWRKLYDQSNKTRKREMDQVYEEGSGQK